MNLTLKMKLLPTEEQAKSLDGTFEAFNAACNYISGYAFKERVFNAFKLHYALYREVRGKFPSLSSQFVVRAMAKVGDSYRIDKKVQHTFKKYSAVVYDQRLINFPNLSLVSIGTIDGRCKIPIVFGNYIPLEKKRMQGQVDLIYKAGKFYLCVVIDVPNETPIIPKGTLGIDLGIVNIATTSDGKSFSGKVVDDCRIRNTKIKASLQQRGSKSAKRHLKKNSGREARFKKDVNHIISKQIVSIAKGTSRAIALEDLTGFNGRQTVRHTERERFGKWAFRQLRDFITYKATIAGIPVVAVDPRNTSRACSACGFVSKSNRKTQSLFLCKSCGHTENADVNGSKNIASRAAANRPIVSGVLVGFSRLPQEQATGL